MDAMQASRRKFRTFKPNFWRATQPASLTGNGAGCSRSCRRASKSSNCQSRPVRTTPDNSYGVRFSYEKQALTPFRTTRTIADNKGFVRFVPIADNPDGQDTFLRKCPFVRLSVGPTNHSGKRV